MPDMERLMQHASWDVRADTAAKVARAASSQGLPPDERQLALEIVAVMLRDTELRVRQALAENLKHNPQLPRVMALRLARDLPEVAVPVLEVSRVLTDEDLIAIIVENGADHQTAVARRPTVSPSVATTLVERGEEVAVATLMGNEGAQINTAAFHRAIDRFAGSELVNGPMVRRKQLPIAIAARLVTIVSDSLKEHLAIHHDLPAEMAADLILQSRERTLLGILADSDRRDVGRLIAELHANRRLTPSLIVRALCTGDLDFFESALAQLGSIPLTSMHALIHDGSQKGLEALYRRGLLPYETMPTVKAALQVVQETHYDGGMKDRARFVERVVERVLTNFDDSREGDTIDSLMTRMNRPHLSGG